MRTSLRTTAGCPTSRRHRRMRRFLRSLSWCSSWLLIAVGCGPPTPPPADELRVAIEDRAKTLDPRFASDVFGQRISRHLIFDSLVQHGDDLEIQPQLAAAWQQPDDHTYIFELRPDVRFHDATPLTTDDVVFTYRQLMDPGMASPFGAVLRQKIRRVEALDERRIRFELVAPTASFLTSIITPILPRHLVESGEFPQRLVGSGPFRLVEQQSHEILLQANEAYFLGPPHVAKLRLRVIEDNNTRFLELRKGNIDLMINALPEELVDLVSLPPLNDDYRIVEEAGLSYNYLAFNFNHPQLAQHAVRQAIAHALDIEQIVEHRLGGHAQRARGLLSPQNPFHAADLPLIPHDPSLARRLLDEAGFADPDGDGPQPRLRFDLLVSNNPQAVSNARIVQAQLRRVGIELSIRSFEWGTFYGDIQAGDFQLTLMRWVGVSDPDFYYDLFHSSQTPPQGRNRGSYRNARMDDLVSRARACLEPVERRHLYHEIQHLAARDLPYVSLWHPNNHTILHRRVEGYNMHPKAGFYPFRKIRLRALGPDDPAASLLSQQLRRIDAPGPFEGQ